jgi:general stress protein 26
MHDAPTRSEAISTLAALIKDIRIATITTVTDEGSLRSRPMATQNAPFDGTLWFFTDADAPKAGEIERTRQVNVSYSAPDDNRYVSVSGTARITRDRARIDELWSPVLKAWFPEGKETPGIALIEVDVEHAEYWDAPSQKIVQVVGLVKALATGKRADPGRNEKLDL